jgi:uncharacterized protein (DUF58 family)
MRSLLGGLTTRGSSFLAAGLAAAFAGLLLGERSLISVGALLFVLPLLAALAASRARYRLSCTRFINPARIPPGHTARVVLRLENISRFPSGLLLAEDNVPFALGTRPRYVLDGIERGGARVLSYPLRSDMRGKFEIGPVEIRIADAFGLVELGRSFSARSTFVVTPKIVPLNRSVVAGSWLGEGDGRTRTAAAAGEDDVVPRAYREGDELRRVHWRSTARYGELMVRREEQHWRNHAMVLLDTRRSAHAGSGAASSFEAAVSAAASVGLHLAGEGLGGQLITDAGPIASTARFEDVLLDTLSVVRHSGNRDLSRATAALRMAEGGLLVVVAGRLSVTEARQLAASRRDGCPAIALLFAVGTWTQAPSGDPRDGQDASQPADAGASVNGQRPAAYGPPASAPRSGRRAAKPGIADETAAAAAMLRAAGWRVTTVDATTPLATAWQRLPHTTEVLGPGAPIRIPEAAG